MKKAIVSLVALIGLLSSAEVLASDTVYRCEGTPEIESTFGELLFWLTEDSAGDFTISLNFGGDTMTEDAKCEPDGKLTGVPGLLTMNCTDEDGMVLPITFNRNDLSLNADFQFPGFGSLLIEAVCQVE